MLWSIIPVTETPPVFSSTRILAADGTLLYEVSAYDGRTTQPVTLDKFPPLFVSAVLAAEDSRFYRHHGIDWRALIRATRDNLLRRRVVGGASTIEQQLVKNFYFRDRRRSFIQKARELIAARWWSLTQTKDETLEIYLNTVYLGNNVFGAPAAAREYFHKDVGDLSLSEATLLAGMIGAPSRYDPLTHLSAAKARQKYVFERMKTMGIDVADAEGAAANVALSIFPPQDNIRAPHFVFRVLDELQEKIPDVWSGGYTITTTLDSDLEMQAAASVERRLYKLAESNVTDAALIAVEPQTGNVLAYIGGLNWRDGESGKINMAKVARQPGSALKPFLYELALMKNFTPATVIADLPVRFETERGSYYPRNYNFKYYGPVTVREALGSSLNIPAVKILNEIGISGFANTLARFGVAGKLP
ncbi:MAG: Penicillin-binding protein [Candidatus Magasanikbacteria bacterium]|nr:Penicillin-binding protein [Candidatus Magasanikbacteria bacterium]